MRDEAYPVSAQAFLANIVHKGAVHHCCLTIMHDLLSISTNNSVMLTRSLLGVLVFTNWKRPEHTGS